MRLVLATSFLVLISANAIAQQPRDERAQPDRIVFWGFAAPWDRASDASIRAHGHHLDVAVTGWIGLDSATGAPLLPSPFADTVNARGRGPRRMAIVTSWHGERFHPSSIRTLASDSRRLAATAGSIAGQVRTMRYEGIVIDFETLEPNDLTGQLRVIRSIADSARAAGARTIGVAVPAMDTSAYPGKPLLAVADFIIPMLYDEHWSGSNPGPVASPQWARQALALRVAESGADRVVAGFPMYGYRWIRGKPTEDMGYDEARRIAATAGVALSRDSASQTLRAQTSEWDMWVTDGVLLRSLVRIAEDLGVRRVALWRLGREDPAVWGSLIRR